MALVSDADILKFLELAADDSFTTVAAIKSGVESAVKAYCRRNLESTSYKDVYVDKNNYIVLKDFPVTAVTKVQKGETSPLYISNSNQFTSAVVSVTETKVVLIYNGVTYAGDLTFATNTTLGALVTAINAAGSGWKAVTQTSDFNSILSTELLPLFGQSALYNRNVQVWIPSQDFPYLDVDYVNGILRSEQSIAGEFEKVYVNYTAGYVTIPADLQYAVKLWVKDIYTRHQESAVGLLSYSITGVRKDYEQIPYSAKLILDNYKRVLI